MLDQSLLQINHLLSVAICISSFTKFYQLVVIPRHTIFSVKLFDLLNFQKFFVVQHSTFLPFVSVWIELMYIAFEWAWSLYDSTRFEATLKHFSSNEDKKLTLSTNCNLPIQNSLWWWWKTWRNLFTDMMHIEWICFTDAIVNSRGKI